jgi:hypothetical protein
MKRDPDGFITALRVLARVIYHESAAPRDINALRRHARVEEMDLPIDELCCLVIQRALGGPGFQPAAGFSAGPASEYQSHPPAEKPAAG